MIKSHILINYILDWKWTGKYVFNISDISHLITFIVLVFIFWFL